VELASLARIQLKDDADLDETSGYGAGTPLIQQ
jgi:hypothetical protein